MSFGLRPILALARVIWPAAVIHCAGSDQLFCGNELHEVYKLREANYRPYLYKQQLYTKEGQK